MTLETAPQQQEQLESVWSGKYRATTVGMLTLITIAAFEHLGVSTAMPSMMADLNGEALYAWPFTVFLIASVMATVLSGRFADRFGPGPALIVGPGLFAVGLLAAGLANTVPLLLVGRLLQGLGLGMQGVAIYVLVALVFPHRNRPAVFGLLAAAWVVPSLIGPTAAGLITEHVGWRWVFLGFIPFSLLGMLLLVPVTRKLPPTERDATAPPARRGLPLAAVAAAFGISALTWAAQHPSFGMLWLGLAGLAALLPAMRTLMPRGTFAARPGLPATVLMRGVLAGAFFGVEAFVPLTLTAVHGFSPAMSGIPLTVGAIGWAGASHWQGRHPDLDRTVLIRVGLIAQAAALAAMALVAADWGLAWLVVPFWLVAGAAMGLAYPSISVLSLDYAAPHERGYVSSALQVNDMTFAAITVGLGGVMLATFASAAAPSAAIVPLNLLLAGLALFGALVFRAKQAS